MKKKYYYLDQEILDKNDYQSFALNLSDIFLGFRLGCLLAIVFLLYYYFLFHRPVPVSRILSPLGKTTLAAASTDNQTNNQVLGEETNHDELISPPQTVSSTASPPPTTNNQPSTINTLPKSNYSIAVFGDSMVDTMGERLEHLEKALKNKYPKTNFTLYNFGQGAQNVEKGKSRIADRFDYQDRHFASLAELNPDILIIGSFAYNPFSPHDPERYRSNLSQLINIAKTITSNVYLLAEIAPLKTNFGRGPNGVNWEENTAYQHATNIIEQLEIAIDVARLTNTPVIDAFTPSQVSSDKSGNSQLVNPSDGIHPSVAGHQFMAEKIVNTLVFK